MVDTPGVPDHSIHPTTVGLSPKALWPTVAMGLVGIVISVLNGVQENPSMLAALPTWLQSLVLLLVPPLVTFLVAYRSSPGTISVNRSGQG
jgi:hypothetical protein